MHRHKNKEEAAVIAGARQVSQINKLHSSVLLAQCLFKHYIHLRVKLSSRIFPLLFVRYFKSWCPHLQNSYFTDDKIHIKMAYSSACHKPNPDYI